MKKKKIFVFQIMLFLLIGGLFILKSNPIKADKEPVGHPYAYNVWCQEWPTQVPGCRDHAWRTCFNTNFCND